MNITEVTEQGGRNKRPKRVGRGPGTGNGKTAGRGHNGSASRAGATRFGLREGGQMPTFRRLPKRGFSNIKFTTRYSIVNVGQLEERFDDGGHVTPQSLRQAGLIRNFRLDVKVLGDGSLKKKLTVDAAKFSESARTKIEAAGGQIVVAKG